MRRMENCGIRLTANRILVAQELEKAQAALSMTELEARLKTLDKSVVFRTLTLLSDNHLVHQIDDGTGQTKYALCEEGCHCSNPHHGMSEGHIHFHCIKCRQTYCLKSEHIPEVTLPQGFHVHGASMVVNGLCPKCNTRYGCKEGE